MLLLTSACPQPTAGASCCQLPPTALWRCVPQLGGCWATLILHLSIQVLQVYLYPQRETLLEVVRAGRTGFYVSCQTEHNLCPETDSSHSGNIHREDYICTRWRSNLGALSCVSAWHRGTSFPAFKHSHGKGCLSPSPGFNGALVKRFS